jgi:hypothetical protein
LRLGADRAEAAALRGRSLTRIGVAVFSWKAAELGDLQAEGLEFDQQFVERLLIGDRPIQDRLDGFDRSRQALEHEKYRVADAAFDPELIVGCHARPSFLVLHHAQV